MYVRMYVDSTKPPTPVNHEYVLCSGTFLGIFGVTEGSLIRGSGLLVLARATVIRGWHRVFWECCKRLRAWQ